ncbi:hypothetical protein FQ186_11660 [Pseudomonas sp. ANT_H14]|uniref:Ig-like domain-containing protein n=1 Tax=unclassified Pseudomonas TaxID=196821 RepID=UPI0011EC5F05|nr:MULTISPECIES: hypothetical protein [unclassified Pseudomonas]KAA0947753.1 hypothetical protein FQ182_08610 [Pseudomonas sp. ANT_H4]KAA0952385.1 hypothetical protein FQ186_11660 [Pseudomonas sp. ANT_H14]
MIEDLDSPYTSPQQVTPVDGAAYGVGIRHLEEGLDYVLERWESINVGDTYRIRMNGIVMAEDTVKPGDVANQRFFLNIPRTTVPLGFIPDVYGEVERVGSTQLSTSPLQVVFIKDTRPGGADDRPHENWHSKLVLTLSDTFIDAVVAARGVKATIKKWENMRVNDLVMFYWGEHRYDVPPITPDQVDLDLEFVIDPDFIALAGSGHFVVQFYLYDEVRNRSGELQPWCKPVPVEVDLDLELLEEPYVVEADEDTMVLDADALGREPAHAEVNVARNSPHFRVGDFILLTVHGTTVDGAFVSESMLQRVDRIPQYYEFPIRNELVRSLIQSTMTVSYVRQRVGEDDLPSRNTTITIAGIRYALPRPSVREAHGPFIEPDLVRITAQMPDYQPPGSPGDNLEVTIQGYRQDNSIERVSSSRLAGIHIRTRDFPNADYMRFEGLRDTNVHYVVTGAIGARESERLWVQIGRPPRDLPAPIILDAINGNVDPATIGSVGTLELRTDFKMGDLVIVKYTGSLSGEQQFEYTLYLNHNPLVLDIPRQLFLDNLDGTLTVSYLIDRFGVTQYSDELRVTVGTALGELFLPEVLQATTEPDELDPALTWPGGATVRIKYEHIKAGDKVQVCWKGLPGIGTHYEVKENQVGGHIDFTIPTEAIGFNIHPDGRDIHVSFQVIRNGYPTPSPVLTLRLLTLHNLPGPLIDSIGDNAVLEIPLLEDFDETRVPAWMYAHLGQRMWLRYQGTRNTGLAYDNYVYRGRDVDDSEVSNGITSETPVLALRNLEEWSELTISFWVTFDHSGDLNNAVLFDVRHHMIQMEKNTYPHPQIKDSTPATGPQVSINPLVVENKCQVLVSYPNMNAGGTDRITLHWIYVDGSMPVISTQDGLDGGTVTFNIGNVILGTSVNSTIRLQYTVELGRGGTAFSEEQTVIVGTIASGSLSMALINNTPNGGSLNPPALTADAIVSAQKWRLSVTGQRVWLRVTSPGLVTQVLLEGHPITAIQQANGLANIPLLRSWLLGVPNNGSVTVSLKVTYDGSEDESRAIIFPSTVYTVRLTSPLVFNSNAVSLNGRTYLIPGNQASLPAFNSGNSIRHTASGGTLGYTYSSNNTGVAVVDSTGYVTVRGNGSATITVRDSSVPAQTRSYVVYVGGVVLCYGLGGGTKTDIDNRARSQGVRLASLNELREISAAYGNSWPMGNGLYWSSTWSHNFLFFDYWYGRNINTGAEGTFKQWVGNRLLGVGLR